MASFNRLWWNSATGYLSLGVSFICSFVLLPITIHYLGKEHYGLLQLAGSLSGYVSLAALGTGSAIMRTVAESRHTHAPADVSPTISTAFFFYLCVAVLGLVVGLYIIRFLPSLFHIPPDQVSLGKWILIISFVGTLITFPPSVFMGVLTGRERFDLINIAQTIQALCLFSGALFVFWIGGRLVSLVLTQTALTVVFGLVIVWLALREIPTLRVSLRLVRWSEFRQILSFGIFVFCIQVAVQISYRTDAIVIGMFLPLGAITTYNIGLRLSEIARDIPSQLQRLLPPVVAKLDGQTQPHELRQLLLESTKWILVVALSVATPLVALARPFIKSWLGDGFDPAVLIAQVLCSAGIVAIAQSPAATVLMYKGRHKLMAFTALAASASNLGLSLVLVQRFGILGVALGTAIPVILADGLLVLPLACKLIDLPLHQLIRKSILPPFAPAVVVYAAAFLGQHYLDLTRLTVVIPAMAVVASTYFMLFCTFSLSREEQRRYALKLRGTIQSLLLAQGGA